MSNERERWQDLAERFPISEDVHSAFGDNLCPGLRIELYSVLDHGGGGVLRNVGASPNPQPSTYRATSLSTKGGRSSAETLAGTFSNPRHNVPYLFPCFPSAMRLEKSKKNSRTTRVKVPPVVPPTPASGRGTTSARASWWSPKRRASERCDVLFFVLCLPGQAYCSITHSTRVWRGGIPTLFLTRVFSCVT